MTGRLTGTARAITTNQAACEAAIAALIRDGAVAKTITRIRGEFGEDLAEILFSVARLQKKAIRKLGTPPSDDHVWWFTEKSLQQATPWQVAKLKSSFFENRSLFDLCCGGGGDALQFARRGPVVAVDSNELMTAMAGVNLANAGHEASCASTKCADATMIEIPGDAAVHIDPDRRGGNARTSQPQHYRPSWSEVRRIIRATESAVVKLAPAAQLAAEDTQVAHRLWISLSGAVREQSLLLGEATAEAGLAIGSRSAVSLTADSRATWFSPQLDEIDSAKANTASQPKSILIDPDAAIRAAGLTEAFSCHHRCELLGSPSGFLTADQLDDGLAMAQIGRVIWAGSCDDRKLRRELRERDCFPALVKVRGSDHDPAKLARRYRRCGQHPVSLWIGRAGNRVFAALAN